VTGLTNGTAYTFTVTATNSVGTGPASAASNSVTPTAIVPDASFAYVPLLLETTSTNGQNNQGTTTTNGFLDSSTNNFTITRNGSPTQGSVTPYWPNGQWSNYFNGSTDYLTTQSTTLLASGTGDFTIEFWLYTAAALTTYNIFDFRPTSTNGAFLTFYLNAGTPNLYGNSADIIIGGFGLSANTWTHIAISRASNSLKLFVNGAQSGGTVTNSTNWNSGTNRLGIGGGGFDASGLLNGYISNLRYVVGTAVYTGNFTPPTTPLAATQSGNGGTIQAITGTATALLTCQSNRFRDNSTNNFTITPNGTPRVQAFQPFSPAAAYTPAAYGGSGYFGGSDSLSAPSNAAFAFGTGDFTIETWVYISNFSNFRGIFDSRASGSATGLALFTDLSGFLNVATTANIATASKAIIANAWSHCAVTRSGTSLNIWLNGENVSTITNSTNFSNPDCSIFLSMLGYISNFRIVKGTAVYTGAFTPPTLAPLTTAGSTSAASYSSTSNVNTSFASSATSLLTNFTNAGIYDAAAQNVVTTVADAQVSTTQSKWPPTSMKFDGTGDYLTIPANLTGTLGTGNWTIEFWQYYSGLTGYQTIISTGFVGGGVTGGWLVQTGLGDGKMNFYFMNPTSTLIATETGTTVLTGQWYYIAIVKSGATLTIYRNGTNVASVSDTRNYSANQTVSLGGGSPTGFDGNWFNGYLQDIRITKGVARTITTPTAPFPVQ
jgi:hypothetical protein